MKTRNSKFKTQNCRIPGGRQRLAAPVTFVAAVFLAAVCEPGLSIGSTGIRSPVRSGTVPPSSLQSGLISSPSPIDTSGNLIITGNVRGGKHFRGFVPYGSPTSFRAPLGSSALDSFLRYSAGSEDYDRNSGRYEARPFYSPTGTVTTTRPGLSGVWTPATTRITGRAALRPGAASTGEVDLRTVPGEQGLSDGYLDASLSSWAARARPMSRTPQEIEQLISDEVGGPLPRAEISSHPRGEGLTAQQYQVQMEQLQRDLKRIGDQAAEIRQTLMAETKPSQDSDKAELQPLTRTEPSEGAGFDRRQVLRTPMAMPAEPTGYAPNERTRRTEGTDRAGFRPAERTREALGEAGTQLPALEQMVSVPKLPSDEVLIEQQVDIYEQTKWQRDPLSKREPTGIEGETGYGLRDMVYKREHTTERDKGRSEQEFEILNLKPVRGQVQGFRIGAESSADVSARAKAILADYESFAAYSKDKYDWYMRAAQVYVKQGKCYRAVDAYTLASIYKPDDPLAYAGKSHALFAAGEYVSSALFLSRVLEILPDYARFKVDLVAIVGDKDKLDDRIADAEECLELSRRAMPSREQTRPSILTGSERPAAAELQFLLGYVYLQLDRLGAAKKAVEAAYISLPDAPAVAILKKAIDDAISKPNR